MGLGIVFGMMVWVTGVVWAEQPGSPEIVLRVDEHGAVVADTLIPVSPDQVRRILSDPLASRALVPEVDSVEVEAVGACHRILTRVQGFIWPLAFRTLRCPAAEGWNESLLESDHFTRYEVQWSVESVEGGTRVRYRVLSRLSLPVSQAMVQSRTEESAQATLLALWRVVVP